MRKSDQLRKALAMDEQEIHQDRSSHQLLKVEDHGEKTHRSKDENTKLKRQK